MNPAPTPRRPAGVAVPPMASPRNPQGLVPDIALAIVLAIACLLPGRFARAESGAGSALAFNSTSAFVTISNSAALNAYPLTIAGWIKTTDNGNGRNILGKYIPSVPGGYQVTMSGGRIRAFYARDAVNYILAGSQPLDGGPIANGAWRHVAFVVSGEGGFLYVDGQLRASQPWTGRAGAPATTQPMILGRADANAFNGQLDEISVWNAALTTDAIARLSHLPPGPNEPGLLAAWRCNEGSGRRLTDLAPDAGGINDGFLSGADWATSDAPITPVVLSTGFSRRTLSSAILNATVNAHGVPTTAWFEWGADPALDRVTPPVEIATGDAEIPIQFPVDGLEPGRTYRYRAIATNTVGRAVTTTLAYTVPVTTEPVGAPPLRSARYDGSFGAYTRFDPAPEWDAAIPMTVEAWVYREDAARTETILSHGGPGSGSYWLGFAPRLRFARGTNSAELAAPFPARKWTHVAVSYDGAIARFYVNGALQLSRALANSGAPQLRPLRLGHDLPGTNSTGTPISIFLGHLDEVRLWSVARSGAEIAAGQFLALRDTPGLSAAFPRGGRLEALHGLVGDSGPGVTDQIVGLIPRDLVVPRAAFTPLANGQIDPATEYLGAEQLVLRYPDQPSNPDAVARLVHTDDDLFVGVTVLYKDPNQWNITNSWLGLFLDPTYARPPLAGRAQAQLYSRIDFTGAFSTWLNGDDAGGYFACFTGGGIALPQPCTPRSLWQAAQLPCNGEISPDACAEFRVSRQLLGTWEEFDGIALGHFNYTAFGNQTLAPDDGFPEAPDTWLTMSYGNGSADLPRVRWTGRVQAGTSTLSPGLANQRVSLFAGQAVHTRQTDAQGFFAFDVPMPTNQVIYAQVDPFAFGRSALPRIGTAGLQPVFVFTNDVRYPALPAGTSGNVQLAGVTFFTQPPLPTSAVTNATPWSPVAGTSIRAGEAGAPGEIVTLSGTNFHDQLQFCLAPVTTVTSDPASWTLIPARVLDVSPDRRSARVETPYVPEQVRAYAGGPFLQSFQSSWRWVTVDGWFRPGASTYSKVGDFPLQRPPYPLMHGFNFDNQGAYPSLNEFLACFGDNAYLCVGAAGICATRVPDPVYWSLWWPIYYLAIGNSGGSCVGMSSTSLQLYSGVFSPADFDPLALRALGIDNPGFPGDWDTSNFGGIFTRPPIPRDIWARIRMNHGVQLSREFLTEGISQLSGFGGDPVGRLNQIRSAPTLYNIAMLQGIGAGHAVTPYRVESSYNGDPNISRIWIYDNESPCARTDTSGASCVQDSHIDIDHAANTYHYRSWSGTAMFAIPRPIYDGGHHAPLPLFDLESILMFVLGDADGLYTTPGGEFGWRADGTFVNTLPGARSLPPIGSFTNVTRSVPLLLPNAARSNGLPDITLNIRGTNAHLFHLSSGGTLLQLELAGGLPGARHGIRLGATSNRVDRFRFDPGASPGRITPKIGLALGPQASATFQWTGLDAEAGQPLEFRALPARRAAELANRGTRNARAFLRLDAVDGGSSNVTCAVFGPFNVPTGAVHCVVLQDWPRNRHVRVELDRDADGTIDEITTIAGTPLDTDGDGLPDGWETIHQLNPMAVDCDDGAESDPDHDGIDNAGEYLAGTDPRDAASALRLDATLLPGGRVRLSWAAVPGRRYQILFAPGLEYVLQPLDLPGFPRVATGEAESVELNLPAGGQAFYRLRLTP